MDKVPVSVECLPLALTVPEASEVLRVGRTVAYELVRCGRLRSIRIGKKIIVPRDAICEFLGMTA